MYQQHLFVILIQTAIILIVFNDHSNADVIQPENNTTCNQISFWTYKCVKNTCQRTTNDNNYTDPNSVMNLQRCRQTCGGKPFQFWPAINGEFNVSGKYRAMNYINYGIHVSKLRISSQNIKLDNETFFMDNLKRFRNKLKAKGFKATKANAVCRGVKNIIYISFEIEKKTKMLPCNLTHENYFLAGEFNSSDKNYYVKINALTRFGARHALETLSQIIIFDEMVNQLVVGI